MKKIVVILFCYILASCMVEAGRFLENEQGKSYDVSEAIFIPDSLLPVKEFYHIEKKDYVPLPEPYTVSVQFGLPIGINEGDIQSYTNDSLCPRLKYSLRILGPVLPLVKLNSFSFTHKKDGDTIPCILYCRIRGREIHIIDSLPAIFTNDVKKELNMSSFIIFAESNQSYAFTEKIYINYDIEVGNKRFIKQAKYSKKTHFDRRPKIW